MPLSAQEHLKIIKELRQKNNISSESLKFIQSIFESLYSGERNNPGKIYKLAITLISKGPLSQSAKKSRAVYNSEKELKKILENLWGEKEKC